MRYEVELSPRAYVRLSKLPVTVQSRFLEELERLAESPVSLSRPSHLPYLPGFQLFNVRIELDGENHSFVVLFKYSQDETTLWIHGFHYAGPYAL